MFLMAPCSNPISVLGLDFFSGCSFGCGDSDSVIVNSLSKVATSAWIWLMVPILRASSELLEDENESSGSSRSEERVERSDSDLVVIC